MAGKLCVGIPRNNMGAAHLQSSKSYCEGMLYRSGGSGATLPITDNPHETGSDAADAWDLGWNRANNAAGGFIDKSLYGCCAPVDVIPL